VILRPTPPRRSRAGTTAIEQTRLLDVSDHPSAADPILASDAAVVDHGAPGGPVAACYGRLTLASRLPVDVETRPRMRVVRGRS
jgi:hypothetical protein